MQVGFILLECSIIRKEHYSASVAKNFLDPITGVLGFWLFGFGIAFSETDKSGFFGIGRDFYASKDFTSTTTEDIWLKFLF